MNVKQKGPNFLHKKNAFFFAKIHKIILCEKTHSIFRLQCFLAYCPKKIIYHKVPGKQVTITTIMTSQCFMTFQTTLHKTAELPEKCQILPDLEQRKYCSLLLPISSFWLVLILELSFGDFHSDL